ncbi:hypothetical protein M427DRAFT_296061 [Gonapodya prolifera JEL478]|uniref:Uncharacterized protein n=1 Tax=Gonapodya prolifera (strain JEL478) TaxID=1344416 RepID=A0A139AHS2_GONPJ|nr:hypothetical protein M427DRAFT_296061 [Gonapodya prolifera JEL478]|eukprot:KXS16310.1 hypothetical protein M427DRAFT_296061 [Gonapodya prolifera JEL478]
MWPHFGIRKANGPRRGHRDYPCRLSSPEARSMLFPPKSSTTSASISLQKTFQKEVTILSRSLRVAACTAIPGYTQGELGLRLTVAFRSKVPWFYLSVDKETPETYPRETARFLPRFERGHAAVHDGRTASVIWASCSTAVVLFDSDLERNFSVERLLDIVISKLNRHRDGEGMMWSFKCCVVEFTIWDELFHYRIGNTVGTNNQACGKQSARHQESRNLLSFIKTNRGDAPGIPSWRDRAKFCDRG